MNTWLTQYWKTYGHENVLAMRSLINPLQATCLPKLLQPTKVVNAAISWNFGAVPLNITALYLWKALSLVVDIFRHCYNSASVDQPEL